MSQITPFHRSDIEYLSKYSVYTVGNKRAVIFYTTDTEYGYRCFVNQVFQQDVLIPNKSIHYVESAAKNWTEE